MEDEQKVHKTVADVIAALQKMPQDAIVIGLECGDGVKVIPQDSGRVYIASTRADWANASKMASAPN